jgi:hypothetical protein
MWAGKKVTELEKGKDGGEIGVVSSLASIKRQNAERTEEMGIWEGDDWMEFFITKKIL